MSNCSVLITKVITSYKNYRGKYKLLSDPVLDKKTKTNKKLKQTTTKKEEKKINKKSTFP